MPLTKRPKSNVQQSLPSIIVIFGITGDLAQRKLLPALYHLFKDNLLDEKTVILGITRRDVTAEELLGNVELCVNEIDKVCDPVALKKVQSALRMHQMSQTDPAEYRNLLTLLNGIEEEKGVCMNRLYYLSIPPQMFGPIVRNLGEQALNKSCQHNNADTRLLVEKPFGYDLKSARELIEETGAWFREEQLFRIDHYLAKDTVQNIIAFREMSPKLEQIWSGEYISAIDITAYEKIDIEGRATFYEEIGALRDFIQSHLLQLLAVVTMELPLSMDSDDVHQKRLELLRAIMPINSQHVAASADRGQYAGYRQEVNNGESATETFARIRVGIDNDRWRGVPITLQTGKAMSEKRTDVHITFTSDTAIGTLVFHIQPDQGIELIGADGQPEYFDEIRPAVEHFNAAHPPAKTGHPDAYERVILDAVRGDHTLFTTSEEVLAAWKVVTDIIEAWGRSDEGLIEYPKGAVTVA
jgi:glucose-6-phosphate 1-dehydrogenase